MFNSQHWQIKLVYAGFGGFLMLIGMLLSPVTAQRDKFGHIECTSLTILDARNNTFGRFGSDQNGGYVMVWGKDQGKKITGVAQLLADQNGGRLDVFGNGDYSTNSLLRVHEGRASVRVGSNGGGVVSATDGEKHGKRGYLMDDRIGVWGKGGGAAVLTVNKIGVWGKASGEKENGSAQLTVNANGGRLDVYGIVDNQARATVQVNAHGNGAVSTWKKDGERFHTLGEATRVPRSKNIPSVTTVGDFIESKIDGSFEGWTGDTIVKLTNGQIWKQTEYRYEYHYAFMPDVFIYKSGGGYKMLVEGTDEAVNVERLE